MSVAMAVTAGILFAAGTYLILQRLLTRIIIGLGLVAHGANLIILGAGGEPGAPPIVGTAPPASFSDPLPQALVLTAIVITFAVTAFLLALAYRSWALTSEDAVEDDIEDRRIAALQESGRVVMSLATLPILIPFAAIGLTLLAWRRLVLQRTISLVATGASLATAVTLLVRVDGGGTIAVAVGGWEAPIGISLAADRFASLMLVAAGSALLGVLVFAVAQRNTDEAFTAFHPVYQTLAAGVALAFLTADIFTLFVAFEIMLTASYVLITHRAGAAAVRSTMTYVVVGLVASALFLVGIGFIYAATGTVNMAELSLRLADIDPAARTALGWFFFMVFGIKAAIFPLFFWLPDSYPTAPTPVTAIFAGLLTKVGVYAIIRTQTLLFPTDTPSTFMLVIAALTMVVGVLGAISQGDIKRILSFHIVSQIGYMIMGLGFFTIAGIAAAILFIVHQIVVKTVMFLVGGLVETASGTGRLRDVDGLLHRFPVIAILFLPAALSLAGLPPFSGFVGKLALIEAGFDSGRWVVVGVSLAASLLTLFSMTKIWAGAFWGAPSANLVRRPAPTMLVATGALVVLSLAIGLAGQPLLDLTTRAAQDLIDAGGYRSAILGGGA